MKDLPFLLRLLDDPSPAVQARVLARLRELGSAVWPELEQQGLQLDPNQRELLRAAIAPDADEELRTDWEALQATSGEEFFLEQALLLLARWQGNADAMEQGPHLLNSLASEYLEMGKGGSGDLAGFLFGSGRFRGAPPDDYYNPLNSNLLYMMETGFGLPISLTALFILVGRRVGITVEGCNFPGHFLARDARTDTWFDPFNRGRILFHTEVDALRRAAPEEMNEPATARAMAVRILRNLALAYHEQGDSTRARFVSSLASL